MNKIFQKSLYWVLSSMVLTGCGLFANETEDPEIEDPTEQVDEPSTEEPAGENTGETTDSDINQDVAAWFPRLDNVKYSYEGVGNEFAQFTWYPQFNKENYYQVATDNGGTVLVEVYEHRDDEIVRIFSYPEAYFRDNFTEIGSFPENKEEEVILKAPLEVGTQWTGSEGNYEITAVNHEIEVPAGTYETIEVTTTSEDGAITKRYYAENVGMVAEVSEGEGYAVESNLETIEENVAEVIPLTVYIPDEQAMGMDTVNAELKLNTNAPARLAIQELLSGQNEDYPEINILPEGTEIQYLFLNNDNIVEVDVSEEFEQMNAGSTGELFFIYNLVNTLSQYYGTDEVLLNVDGQPFEGGHMILEEGETLQFNEEMVNE